MRRRALCVRRARSGAAAPILAQSTVHDDPERNSVARSPTPRRSWATVIWRSISSPYSERSTERKTPMAWAGGAVGEPGEREGEPGVGALLVVDQEGAFAHLGHVDDLEAAVRALDDAALALGAEADRFAVVQRDQHVERTSLP